MIEASKNRTANTVQWDGQTYRDSVSRAGEDFMEPQQATIKTQHAKASAKECSRLTTEPPALDSGCVGRSRPEVSVALTVEVAYPINANQ